MEFIRDEEKMVFSTYEMRRCVLGRGTSIMIQVGCLDDISVTESDSPSLHESSTSPV